MREMQLLEQRELVAAADRGRRRAPFADAVHGEHHRILERRGIERARRVAHVMLGEQEPVRAVEIRIDVLEPAQQHVLLEQLFPDPDRDRHRERSEAARREAEIGFEQPLEFQERLLVEHDIIDVLERDTGLFEAIANRVDRKARVVLLAREALFLRRRDDLAVDQQRRGAVVIEGGNAEDAHAAKLALA